MKGKNLWIVVALLAVAVGAIVIIQSRKRESAKQTGRPANEALTQTRLPLTTTSTGTDSRQVPAHYEVPPSSGDLRPVLSAGQFNGKTREAYEAVKQIPVMLAQMPC